MTHLAYQHDRDLHDENGEHRSTARTANGRAVESHERRLRTHLERHLTESEAYHDDPEGARRLFERGFRPTEANRLKPGMLVCYRSSFDQEYGPVGETLIGDVMDDEQGTITVSTLDRGNVEVDECAEVWARWP